MEGDLTLGGGHTIQYTDDALQNYILETYIILLTNATPKDSVIFFNYMYLNLIRKCPIYL